MSRDSATLLDIMRAARLSVEFKGTIDKREFANDRKTQSAILHQLLVLGEAVKRLSGEFRTQHPGIPWKSIAGMRDKLIHGYDDVDLEEVWNVVSVEIPRLVSLFETLAPPEVGK